MDWGAAHFRRLSIPIISSPAFSRLRTITFLGILSPKFGSMDGYPMNFGRFAVCESDRSRAHHSFFVAKLIGKVCSKLCLSRRAIDYAVMWGLLHDIATWPLSHTGEAAFSRSTETSARKLRAMMINGSDRISKQMNLYSLISEAGLEHDKLSALFDKSSCGLDAELTVVHKLIHSALTPDTLEGMHRSGRAFGVNVPNPESFVSAFERDLICGVRLRKGTSCNMLNFWKAKAKIYSNFINSSQTIEFESMWSQGVINSFSRTTLNESLLLDEGDVIRRVMSSALAKTAEIQRYKPPLEYALSKDYRDKKSFNCPIPLDTLSSILIKRSWSHDDAHVQPNSSE